MRWATRAGMRLVLAMLAAHLALTGCDSECGDGVSADELTLQSADMTVTVTTRPYSLTVRDASGNVVAERGTIGWTTGTFGVGKALYNGYYFFESHFDPW